MEAEGSGIGAGGTGAASPSASPAGAGDEPLPQLEQAVVQQEGWQQLFLWHECFLNRCVSRPP
jgi:hypothetical protein